MNTRNRNIKAHQELCAQFAAFDKNESGTSGSRYVCHRASRIVMRRSRRLATGALEHDEIVTWFNTKPVTKKLDRADPAAIDLLIDGILEKLHLPVPVDDSQQYIPVGRAEEAEVAFASLSEAAERRQARAQKGSACVLQ